MSPLLISSVGPRVALGAGGIYALRCVAFTLGLATFALEFDGTRFPAIAVFAATVALGVGFGLFAFLADYRARRGRRTALSPVAPIFLLVFAVPIVLVLLFHSVRAAYVGTFDFGRATTLPCGLLVALSFQGRLAPWPWSPPPQNSVPPESA